MSKYCYEEGKLCELPPGHEGKHSWQTTAHKREAVIKKAWGGKRIR